MSKKVLVVAAHADDETLGCGGTIARHLNEGDAVSVLLMADGTTSRLKNSLDDVEHRNEIAQKAMANLGVQRIYSLGFPDNKMDALPLLDVVQPLERILDELQPQVIYTHHFGDLNVDHQITHRAVMTACRPQPNTSVREIYAFEVLSATEWSTPGDDPFIANYFIDISNYMDSKMAALKVYESEMRDVPHSRSYAHVEALAAHRGFSVGFSAAEAFSIVRVLK